MRKRALWLAVLVGCGFTAPPDRRVRRTFEHVSIGTSLVHSPQDVSAFDGSFLQPDPGSPNGMRRIPAEHPDLSSWGATLDKPLPLQYLLPDYPMPISRVLDFSQPEVQVLFGVLEHPGAQLAPTGSIFAVNVTLDHPVIDGETFLVYTVGEWAQQSLPAAVGAPALGMTFPHELMSSISGRPHAAYTQADAVMILRYGGGEVTGAFTAAPFTETGADQLSGSMTGLTDDLQLDVMLDRDQAAARLAAASPAVGSAGVQYSITAAPGASLASSSGPTLRGGQVPAATTHLNAPYNNPFANRGWPALLLVQAYASRAVTTRLLPVTLNSGIYEYRLAGQSGTATLPAGLPQGLTFDGVPLSSDNLVLPQPTRPVKVEFLNDRPESSTLFQINLYELAPNPAGTALVYQIVIAFVGPAPRFTLPADLFIPGKLYTIRAYAYSGGYDPTALAAGDLTQRVLPYALGYFDAGVFEVQ